MTSDPANPTPTPTSTSRSETYHRLCITGSPKNKSKATHSIHKLSTSFDLVGPLAIEDIKPEKIADLLAKASQQETRDVVLDAYLSQGRVWDAFTAHEIVTATKSFDSTRVSTESEVDDSADDTCNRSIFSKLMCKPLKIQPSLALTVNPNTATPAFESNIVVKLTSPDVNPTNDRDRVEEITREAWIYEHVLKPLQGDIVPRFYGVFAGIHRVWKTPWFSDAGHWEEMLIFAAVMEHAGETASERDVKRMATSEREAILKLYTSLHNAGLVHHSCKVKHWVKAANAKFKLIDFGLSVVRDGGYTDVPPGIKVVDYDGFWRRAENEINTAKENLGLV